MDFGIFEPAPGSEQSIRSVMDWVSRAEERADNAEHLWESLIPTIRQSIKFELSDANPNSWPKLSPRYLDYKREMGWPLTIGVATGAMKKALTTNAKIKTTKDYLIWGIDGDAIGHDGMRVGDYAPDFHSVRELFGYTIDFIQQVIRDAITRWIGEGR